MTPDVGKMVREYKAGKVEFRNDAGGNVHAVVGKISFDAAKAGREHLHLHQPRHQPQTSLGARPVHQKYRHQRHHEPERANPGPAELKRSFCRP